MNMNMKKKLKKIESKLIKFFKDEDRVHKNKQDKEQSEEPESD